MFCFSNWSTTIRFTPLPCRKSKNLKFHGCIRTAAALSIHILDDRGFFLKDFLTVMMVYSSFKTACFNWSHINSRKIQNIEQECLPLEGG